MTEKFVTRKELADAFTCTVATIRRWEKLGRLKPVRLGASTVRYARTDVEKFLANAKKQ